MGMPSSRFFWTPETGLPELVDDGEGKEKDPIPVSDSALDRLTRLHDMGESNTD